MLTTRRVSGDAPRGKLHIIDGTDHGFNLQAADAYNRALRDFLG